jgi:hypothetical protein
MFSIRAKRRLRGRLRNFLTILDTKGTLANIARSGSYFSCKQLDIITPNVFFIYKPGFRKTLVYRLSEGRPSDTYHKIHPWIFMSE